MKDVQEHLVVIGGTAAGASAASRARKLDPSLPITVFEKTGFVTYGSCGLPYYIGKEIKDYSDLVTYTPEFLKEKRCLDVKIFKEVTAVDIKAKRVVVRDVQDPCNTEEVSFSKLIFATGASPVIPPIKGINLKNVFTLRTIEDGINIKEHIDRGGVQRAAIIGGGFIGLEMAEALRNRGLDVYLFEMLPRILPQLDEQMSDIIQKELHDNGVHVYTGCSVNEIMGQDGKVKEVITKDGDVFSADFVILSVGVRPNTSLAQKAGIETGLLGGILVNEYLQTSQPDVWACGDCVQMYDMILKEPTYVPLGTTANKQGKIAGENALGGKVVFPGVLGTQATKVFNLFIAATGLSEDRALQAGKEVVTNLISKNDRASYYPGHQQAYVKLILEKSGKLLGAQILGSEGAALRINVLVTAISAGMDIKQLNELDLVYAPPVAPVYDPILIAASEGIKALKKGEGS